MQSQTEPRSIDNGHSADEGGNWSRSGWTNAIAFEPVPTCYVCASTAHTPAFKLSFFDQTFQWVRCSDCGLVFQSPRLTKSSLDLIYNSELYWRGHSDAAQPPADNTDELRLGYNNYEMGHPYRLAQAGQRVQALSRHVPSGSRILEVGCAAGFFLSALKKAGYQGTGIELSAAMADYGRSRLAVDIQVGDFDHLEIPPGSYDGIAAWGCDSNFHDVRKTYSHMVEALRPGGILAFNYFDFDHPARLLLGSFKRVYNAIYYFNRRNVARLLTSLDLEIVSHSIEFQYTCLEEVASMTGRPGVRTLAGALGIERRMLRLPILGSYLLVARKVAKSSKRS
ncbi:MAG: class I SAM-dependent methyltransferase [Candidatus Xenobium sp.]